MNRRRAVSPPQPWAGAPPTSPSTITEKYRDAVAQRTTHTTHLPGTTDPPGVSVAGPSGAAPGGGRALGGDAGARAAGAGARAAGAGARGFATAFLCLAI